MRERAAQFRNSQVLGLETTVQYVVEKGLGETITATTKSSSSRSSPPPPLLHHHHHPDHDCTMTVP